MAQIALYKDPELYRKQTLYVLIAAALAGLCFVVPLFATQAGVVVTALGFSGTADSCADLATHLSIPVSAIFILVIVELLVILAFFRNRKIQKLLIYSAMSVVALATYLLFHFTNQAIEAAQRANLSLSPSWGLALPIGIIVLLFMALSGIKADEKKLRAMNRFW